MNPSPDESSNRRHSTAGLWIAMLLLLLPPYVLSVGPAVMLRDNGKLSQDTFLLIYAPLILLTHFSSTNQALEWYLSFWSN